MACIPLSIRRALAPYLPIPRWGKMLDIVNTMESQSKNVFYSKRRAFEMGDEAVKHQIGEGRDIMSILSKYYLIHLESSYGEAHAVIVKANIEASDEDKLPDEELLGQMS